MNPLRLLINGSKGRMGQMLIALAKADPAFVVAAEIDAGDDFAGAIPNCDVVIAQRWNRCWHAAWSTTAHS
jgi:4-hydroxy-tetrahydrodipicolinate reductase